MAGKNKKNSFFFKNCESLRAKTMVKKDFSLLLSIGYQILHVPPLFHLPFFWRRRTPRTLSAPVQRVRRSLWPVYHSPAVIPLKLIFHPAVRARRLDNTKPVIKDFMMMSDAVGALKRGSSSSGEVARALSFVVWAGGESEPVRGGKYYNE